MKQINLYRAEFRPHRVLLPARKMALSGGVFAVGLLALYFWNGWQLKQLQQEVGMIERQVESVTRQVETTTTSVATAPADVLREAAAMETRLLLLQRAQEAIAGGAIGSETGYAAHFRALSRAIGDSASPGAWLTGVVLFDNGRAMDLRGRSLGGAESARLVGNLRREPLFVGMSFAALQVQPPPPLAAAAPETAPLPPRYLEFSLNARLQEPSGQVASVAVGAP